jgi:hypothetical protein
MPFTKVIIIYMYIEKMERKCASKLVPQRASWRKSSEMIDERVV